MEYLYKILSVMKVSKGKIQELIDSSNNIIGDKDKPEFSVNNDSDANRTTDYNAKVHGQNYKNDFLGRFGFYFYESDGDNKKVEDILAKIMYEKYKETLNHYHENPEKLEKDWELHQNTTFEDQPEGSREHDYEWANDILKALAPHMKNTINEAAVVEDKIKDKKDSDNNLVSKKSDNDIVGKDKKLKKVAGLLDKLSHAEVDKLISLLEKKKIGK